MQVFNTGFYYGQPTTSNNGQDPHFQHFQEQNTAYQMTLPLYIPQYDNDFGAAAPPAYGYVDEFGSAMPPQPQSNMDTNGAGAPPAPGFDSQNFQAATYYPPHGAEFGAVDPSFGASTSTMPPQPQQMLPYGAAVETMDWFNQPIPMEPFAANFRLNGHDQVAQHHQPAVFQAQNMPQPNQPLAPIATPAAPNVSDPATPTLPIFTNVPATTPHPDVTVELRDRQLWSIFHEQSTEMITTIWGKELFPRLAYKVQGLKDNGSYQWSVRLVRTSPFLKKWDSESKCWRVSEKVDNGPEQSIEIFSKIKSGNTWTKDGVNFDKDQVYNVPGEEKWEKKMTPEDKKKWENDTKGKMAVNSHCTYMPVLTLNELCWNGTAMMITHTQNFRFPEAEFIAVTQYKNLEIKKLKSIHNPYIDKERKRKAKEGDTSVKRRKRKNSGEDSGFSSQSSEVSSTGTTPMATPPQVDFQYYGWDGSCPSTSGY